MLAARELNVTATLSVPLIADDAAIGALNLYSRSQSVYGADAVASASAFADQLGVAAARVTVLVEGYGLSQQLQQAMESRAVIEQAKGILIAAEGCTPEEAFDILKRASRTRTESCARSRLTSSPDMSTGRVGGGDCSQASVAFQPGSRAACSTHLRSCGWSGSSTLLSLT